MHSAAACSAGGAASVITIVVTVLDGLCLASSNQPSFEAAIVSLSTIGCVALILLLVLRQIHPQTKIWPWKSWQSVVHGLLIGYLFFAAGITAGVIGKTLTTTPSTPLFVARNILWALSVFAQAIFSGLLLVPKTNSQNGSSSRWPRPRDHEMSALPDRSHQRNTTLPDSTQTLVETFRPRLTLNLKASNHTLTPWNPSPSNVPSRVSSRYSGRTLYHQEPDHNSIDLHSGVTSTKGKDHDVCNVADQEEPPSLSQQQQQQQQQATSPTSPSGMPHRSNSEARRSTDSLLILPSPGLPSPIETSSPADSSCAETNKPTRQRSLPKLNLPPNEQDQMNIHPLFRACSPSPPPTPLPGTMVKASPAAGTTISPQTLNRVRWSRSSNSLRVSEKRRSQSPFLLERMDLPEGERSEQDKSSIAAATAAATARPMPGIIMAADIRSSMMQYEKRYELNESPHEG